ncbi:ARP2/3 complex, 21 kDa p21-Arc subunit [Nadsonia fulvescens var. elongata DSM 6958]|uniref:Actin-related protein 2/3 complex subunit 3 n=1 Tax=Nadsonia fulvescens var. elongata DSM 6958 TaxID=857566 RepID=A0A1E3PJ41_9ASCO|nr:ARP2/3 complex, 21 kDa p21-Arc subunit [Nadsonia fulvescens var. elongata DSM 6958]
MPAYHSTFLVANDADTRLVGNFAILPMCTKFRGPSYPCNDDYDIIDEILDLFRANSFFRNFEIKGPADRTLIYGILYISDCLSKLRANTPLAEANKILNTLSVEHFSIPGDPAFPLNSLYQAPRDRNEAELLRGYLTQFRQELAVRLLDRIYAENKEAPNKFWLAFTRRKFMNKSFA